MRTNGRGWRFAWAIWFVLPLLLAGNPAAALAADVHDIHISGDTAVARPCTDCHTGSAHNSGSVTGGSGTVEVPTTETIGTVEFNYLATETPDTDGVYNPQTQTCENVDCHFGPSGTGETSVVQTPDLPLRCGPCHGILDPTPASADVDDFVYGNGTLAVLSATQWNESGHGASGTYASGNPGANFAGPDTDPEGCAYCHDFFTVDHGSATNPFRLANYDVKSHGWNDACLVCHATGDAGFDPDGTATGYALRGHSGASQGKPVDAAHYGASHNNAGDGGKFCWDCHDPHGDRSAGSGNIYMLQSAVSVATDGVYGIPATNGTVNFTRKTISPGIGAPGYYVETQNPTATGVCQACHTATSYWKNDGSGTGHNADAVCTSCHMHKRQFTTTCADCHGNSTAGTRWPDSLANNSTRSPYADDAGAHQKHVDAIYTQYGGSLPGSTETAKRNNTCDFCHPGNPPPGHPDDATSGANLAEVTRMDTGGNGFAGPPAAGDYWSHAEGAAATGGTPVFIKTITHGNDTTAYLGFTGGALVCYNASCHNGNPSPAWHGSSDVTPPAVASVLVNGSASHSFQQGSTAQVTLTAVATDANAITAGEYFIGAEGEAGTGTPMSAADGHFNGTSESLTATLVTSAWTALNPTTNGVYTLYVDAKDTANNWGPPAAATVTVTVTPLDKLTVANTPAAAGNVNPGGTDVLMQTVTLSVTPGSVDLLAVKVRGTRTGVGDVAAEVAQVKICRDDGDGAWEGTGTDLLIGSGTLHPTTKEATIDIADQALASGASYLHILFDVSAGALSGEKLGAQLTGLTCGSTDWLGTTLPVPLAAQDVKTVVIAESQGPVVSDLRVNGQAVPPIQARVPSVLLTATADDTAMGNNAVMGAEYSIGATAKAGGQGDGQMAPSDVDGVFDDPVEGLTATINTEGWAAGTYQLWVRAKDLANNWGNAVSIEVYVSPEDGVVVNKTNL